MGEPRPLRDLVLVERIRETMTAGGLHIPETFAAKGPSLRFAAKADYFRARVRAVGTDAAHELSPGDEVLVHTFAGGDGKQLYTGEGTSEGLFVRYPDDIVCAVSE